MIAAAVPTPGSPPGPVGAPMLQVPLGEQTEAWLASIATATVRPCDWETAEVSGVLADSIAGAQTERLGEDELLAGVVGWERVQSWAAAAQARMMAAFAERRARQGGAAEEFCGEEIAAALRVAPRTGTQRLDRALEFTSRLPATLAALERGDITLSKARVLAEETSHLPVEAVSVVEQRVLGEAPGKTPGQLRRAVKRAVLALDRESAAHREERAREERKVFVSPLPDGMAEFIAVLPAVDAVGLYNRLDDLARSARDPGERRSMDQRRADALRDVLWGQAGPAARPLAQIVVTDATVIGVDQQSGELEGYGPITAAEARRIAADGIWQALRTDATGWITGGGRNTYRPSPALASYIRGRDGRCRFPGCGQPARNSDIDHTVAFPVGETGPNNLEVLCRRHHRLKTDSDHRPDGWKVQQQQEGIISWTSPTGRRYLTRPRRFPEETDPEPNPPPITRE